MREIGIPSLAVIPDAASLANVIFRRADAEPGGAMLRKQTDGNWQHAAAAQFRAEVAVLARGLIAAGIEPRDRVGLM